MPSARPRLWLLWGALLALLPQLVLGAVAPGLVVCQEANGRTALEQASADCCPDELVDCPGLPGAPDLHASDDCSACDDAPLGLSWDRSAPLPSLVLTCTPLALPSWELLPPARTLRPARPRDPPGLASPHLRTTVLRC